MTGPNGRPQVGVAWTELADGNRTVARQLAAAERDRIAAQQRTADADAAAQRQLFVAEQRLRLADQQAQSKDERRERRRQERRAAKDTRRTERQKKRTAAAKAWNGRIEAVRENSAAVYSGAIYALAVSGAVYGQVDAAVSHGLPWPVGAIAAGAIEGTGLSMALTAQQQRLDRERATAARALTWVCTGGAVAINFFGHHDEPVKAVGLSFLSALGIIVYEVRSGAKHRKALRANGTIPEPMERFGWRRWVADPGGTWAAWRLDALTRVSPGAATLIKRAEAAAAEHAKLDAAQRAEADRERATRTVMALAEKAASKAARRGETGPALVTLINLARTGQPPEQPALPAAPEPVDPQVAELCEMVRSQAQLARRNVLRPLPAGMARPARDPSAVWRPPVEALPAPTRPRPEPVPQVEVTVAASAEKPPTPPAPAKPPARRTHPKRQPRTAGRPRKGDLSDIAEYMRKRPDAGVSAVAKEFGLTESTARRRIKEAQEERS